MSIYRQTFWNNFSIVKEYKARSTDHWHQNVEMVYVLTGQAEIKIANTVKICKPEVSNCYIDAMLSPEEGFVNGGSEGKITHWNTGQIERILMRDGVDGAWIHHNHIHNMSHACIAIENTPRRPRTTRPPACVTASLRTICCKVGRGTGNFRVTTDPDYRLEGEPAVAIVTVSGRYASIQQDVLCQMQRMGNGKYLFKVYMRSYLCWRCGCGISRSNRFLLKKIFEKLQKSVDKPLDACYYNRAVGQKLFRNITLGEWWNW